MKWVIENLTQTVTSACSYTLFPMAKLPHATHLIVITIQYMLSKHLQIQPLNKSGEEKKQTSLHSKLIGLVLSRMHQKAKEAVEK